jgi:hypothetical protein
LKSSQYHLFVLHLRIDKFWSARSNHTINIHRKVIDSCHSACIPILSFYTLHSIDSSVHALEIMMWDDVMWLEGFFS